MRTALGLFTALTLISSTAQASPYASAVATAVLDATPGYATPGEAPPAAAPAPAPTAAPQPYETQPVAQPAPYGDPVAQPAPQVYGPQSAPAPYQPPQQQRRRGKGMMISGFVTFGASYLVTALVGAAALDSRRALDSDGSDLGETSDDVRLRQLGGRLLIPVFGPLAAIPQIDSATGTMAAVFSFIAQAGGLSLGIAGAVRYTRDGRRMQAPQAGLHLGKGVRLGAAPRLGGGNLNLTYRF
ncbi:MAG: hypothetical protein H0T76_02160 [Nannocystis sp.]|nr:hypothetical protein [Nannocystis sp.]MBA3545266.1 hypothetical protein [Nannocystis sp.]